MTRAYGLNAFAAGQQFFFPCPNATHFYCHCDDVTTNLCFIIRESESSGTKSRCGGKHLLSSRNMIGSIVWLFIHLSIRPSIMYTTYHFRVVEEAGANPS